MFLCGDDFESTAYEEFDESNIFFIQSNNITVPRETQQVNTQVQEVEKHKTHIITLFDESCYFA